MTLIIFLAVGLVGVSFSVCRSFMSEMTKVRMVGSCCNDDVFCQMMCLLGQDDSPAIVQKAFLNSWDALALFFFPEFPPQSIRAERQGRSAQLEIFVPGPRDEVYLLNSAFLI